MIYLIIGLSLGLSLAALTTVREVRRDKKIMEQSKEIQDQIERLTDGRKLDRIAKAISERNPKTAHAKATIRVIDREYEQLIQESEPKSCEPFVYVSPNGAPIKMGPFTYESGFPENGHGKAINRRYDKMKRAIPVHV